MENREELLQNLILKLGRLKREQMDKIAEYDKEIEEYIKSIDTNIDEQYLKEFEKEVTPLVKRQIEYDSYIAKLDHERKTILSQKNKLVKILAFDLKTDDFEHFKESSKGLSAFRDASYLDVYSHIGKKAGVPYNISREEYKRVYGSLLKSATLFIQYEDYEITKKEFVDAIKETFGTFNPFYDKNLVFFDSAISKFKIKVDEIGNKVQETRDRLIQKQIDKINERIKDLHKKSNECLDKIASIDEIYKLYDKYLENNSHDNMILLSNELSKIGVITKRELKILRHQKVEKVEVKEEIKPEEKTEEKNDIEPVKQNELDNVQYYLDGDVRNIICFLGNDNDSLDKDIDSHFNDNSSKPIILRELNDIFNKLVFDSNYIQIGGKPKYFTNDKVKAIQATPYKFNYKRFGVSKDQFRIHAIDRQSKLLQKLGYGSGHIVFFGAVGVNDDKEKSGAYERLGSRVISELSDHGRPAKLRSSFDSIEHITRGYIPISFLSDNDKSKLKLGGFVGKDKVSGLDKAIENSSYILFEVLDEVSQSKVNDYLNEYFMKQSEKMFDYINSYKELKENNFD